MKLTQGRLRPVLTLTLAAVSLCCIFALSAFTDGPAHSINAASSPSDCHKSSFSHQVGNSAIANVDDERGNVVGTLTIQLMWCKAYQSHFGRYTYSGTAAMSTLSGACYLVEQSNSTVKQGMGCTSPLGQDDTPLVSSPTGKWEACFVYGANHTPCTKFI